MSELFTGSVEVENRCSEDALGYYCEVYVPARSKGLPTLNEGKLACKNLGVGWVLNVDQSESRPGYAKCTKLKPKILPTSSGSGVKGAVLLALVALFTLAA